MGLAMEPPLASAIGIFDCRLIIRPMTPSKEPPFPVAIGSFDSGLAIGTMTSSFEPPFPVAIIIHDCWPIIRSMRFAVYQPSLGAFFVNSHYRLRVPIHTQCLEYGYPCLFSAFIHCSKFVFVFLFEEE